MSEIGTVLRGVVHQGVVILDRGVDIPDGTSVELRLQAAGPAPAAEPPVMTPEERVEFEFWERLGDEAWAMIDEWEREDRELNGGGDAAR